ncbi:MAG: patatin-like phospholipase family protein, partial [Hyphomicrobiales bacterium]|nr:patatin-like phospholipase family protein [Hyphomicrobiales bacterium]
LTSYAPGAAATGAAMWEGMQKLADMMSPYDLNPLDINPLRDILLAKIDFERLNRESPAKLFIAATEVTSGRARIFANGEISADAVLASACLPKYFPAVKIGRFNYWDGGFSANPDLTTLIPETRAGDTLLVRINPARNPELPVSREEIAGNVNRLTYNQPLRNQIRQIESIRHAVRFTLLAPRRVQRLAGHRLHLVDGSRTTRQLAHVSKSRPDWPLIKTLKEDGRREAMDWIANGLNHVGRRSGVDLHAQYFTDRLPFD